MGEGDISADGIPSVNAKISVRLAQEDTAWMSQVWLGSFSDGPGLHFINSGEKETTNGRTFRMEHEQSSSKVRYQS